MLLRCCVCVDFAEGDYGEEERTRKYIKQPCLAKLVCLKKHEGRENVVIGFHYLGPNAGEITQGAWLHRARCRCLSGVA